MWSEKLVQEPEKIFGIYSIYLVKYIKFTQWQKQPRLKIAGSESCNPSLKGHSQEENGTVTGGRLRPKAIIF
jgi:hypothetical protein